MPVQMLVVHFAINCLPADYVQAMQPLVDEISNAQGLRWKIWLLNEAQCTAGGLYLWDDEPSVRAFLGSPLIDRLRHHPSVSDFRVMPFDILEAETRTTHGPVGAGSPV